MSIQKNDNNSKEFDVPFGDAHNAPFDHHTVILLVILLISVAFASFSLGRLSMREVHTRTKSLVVETVPPSLFEDVALQTTPSEEGEGGAVGSVPSVQTEPFLVGSKNSTKYHFPWCSGAKRIKEENLVTFSSYDDARARGYTPASNCDGLQ